MELEQLHRRWLALWRTLDDSRLERTFQHPQLGEMRIDEHAAFYAWHGAHNIAHITRLRDRNDW